MSRLATAITALLLLPVVGVVATRSASPLDASAATLPRGGVNVEPSARPTPSNHGINPDSWWCPTPSQCTTTDPLGRIDHELTLIQQLHAANVRLEVPWFALEPSRGQYDWSRSDYIVSDAARHGVWIQAIFVYTPSWDGGYNAFPPPGDFQAFVAAFVSRYGAQLSAVEMWNEPDQGAYLTAVDPARYVSTILAPGYAGVKSSAHPGVPVIVGGSINDSGTCCPWLSGIYNAGGGSSFDIAAFHDYGGNFSSVVQSYQSILNAHGQGSKPIWMGEYGVQKSDPTGSVSSGLIQSALSTPGLAMAQFYTLRDAFVYTCCPAASTGEQIQDGLVAANGTTLRSSYSTMQQILAGRPGIGGPPPASFPGGSGGSAGSPPKATSAPRATPTAITRVVGTATPAPSTTPTPTASPSAAPTASPTPATPPGSDAVAIVPPSSAPDAATAAVGSGTSHRWIFVVLAALAVAAVAGAAGAPRVLRRIRKPPPS